MIGTLGRSSDDRPDLRPNGPMINVVRGDLSANNLLRPGRMSIAVVVKSVYDSVPWPKLRPALRLSYCTCLTIAIDTIRRLFRTYLNAIRGKW